MTKLIKLFLGFTLLVTLTGCQKENGENPLPIKKPLESEQPATVYDDHLIEEIISEQGLTVDNTEYSYHVPQLVSDQPKAKEINQAVKDHFTQIINDSKAMMEQDQYPVFSSVSWQSSWNGSLLSMKLVMDNIYHYEDIVVFNYDFATDTVVDNRELLRRLNRDEQTLIRALRRAAAQHYDKENRTLLNVEYFDAMADLRCRTLSEPNLNLDTVHLFLDDQGKLCALTQIGCMAAYGSYLAVLPLDLEPETGITKKVSWNFAEAELKNNQVTVTFMETADSGMYMPSELGIIYNYPYRIKGLYGNYTDIAIGNLEIDRSPYVILLDENGMITFCNLMLCTGSGIELNATGPYWTGETIESLDVIEVDDEDMLVSLTEENEYHFMDEEITALCNTFHFSLQEGIWIDDSGRYTFNSDMKNGRLAVGAGGGVMATGEMRYAGMNEKGLIYPLYLYDEAGERVVAHLTLQLTNTLIHPDAEMLLTLTQFLGPQLIGDPGQYQTCFHPQW